MYNMYVYIGIQINHHYYPLVGLYRDNTILISLVVSQKLSDNCQHVVLLTDSYTARGGTGEVQGRGPCHVYIRDETCTDASGGVGVVT